MDEQELVKPGRCVQCQRGLVRDDHELCWRCRLEQARATLEHLRTLLRENGRSESRRDEGGENSSTEGDTD